MTTESRYQVYISTTYPDMRQSRESIMLPMMDLGLIPSYLEGEGNHGNTLSPLVQRMISDCDYFILLVGGRYGPLSPMGLSETHREYIFAATKRKPVIAFIHDNPASLPDSDRELERAGQVRRDDFVRLLENKAISYRWSSEKGLAELVSRVMPDVMRQHTARGWVRAGEAHRGEHSEVAALKRRIAALEKEREEALANARPPLKTLSRGGDRVPMDYSCNVYDGGHCRMAMTTTEISWDQAFSCVAPLMLNPAAEPVLQKALEDFIARYALNDVRSEFPKAHAVRNVVLASHSFNQVKIHLRALGLITKSAEKDARGMPLWQLTPHGDNTMNQIMTVKRGATV